MLDHMVGTEVLDVDVRRSPTAQKLKEERRADEVRRAVRKRLGTLHLEEQDNGYQLFHGDNYAVVR